VYCTTHSLRATTLLPARWSRRGSKNWLIKHRVSCPGRSESFNIRNFQIGRGSSLLWLYGLKKYLLRRCCSWQMKDCFGWKIILLTDQDRECCIATLFCRPNYSKPTLCLFHLFYLLQSPKTQKSLANWPKSHFKYSQSPGNATEPKIPGISPFEYERGRLTALPVRRPLCC
jgi:hypothetical protein